MIYRGRYLASDGHRIPFVMGTLANNKMLIKYDVEGKRLPVCHEIPIKHNTKVVWKCNAKSISCDNTYDMFMLFERDSAYANATFRHFTGIK